MHTADNIVIVTVIAEFMIRSTTLILHACELPHTVQVQLVSRNMKVIVTGSQFHICIGLHRSSTPGASGVLGSAVFKAFKDAGSDVIGLAHSRVGEGLVKLDLTNKQGVEDFFTERRPDCKIPD